MDNQQVELTEEELIQVLMESGLLDILEKDRIRRLERFRKVVKTSDNPWLISFCGVEGEECVSLTEDEKELVEDILNKVEREDKMHRILTDNKAEEDPLKLLMDLVEGGHLDLLRNIM